MSASVERVLFSLLVLRELGLSRSPDGLYAGNRCVVGSGSTGRQWLVRSVGLRRINRFAAGQETTRICQISPWRLPMMTCRRFPRWMSLS